MEPLTRRPFTCTPWGVPNLETHFGPEATFYSTPSHGGFRVTGSLAAKIRATFPTFRTFTERQQPGGPWAAPMRADAEQRAGLWLEEDCDWAALALVAPELFPADHLPHAERLRQYIITGKLRP